MGWASALLVLLQLHALGVPMPAPPPPPPIFQAVQDDGKPILPAHVRGPHEGEEGAFCYRGDTESRSGGRTFYHCECELICEDGAGGERLQREADACVTACDKTGKQCKCHGDSRCEEPMVEKPK